MLFGLVAMTAVAGTQTQTKLVAADADAGDLFGLVALDGDRALIGAGSDDCSAGILCGAAYVFEEEDDAWVQVHNLVAADAAAFDGFGLVALDGDRALIGATGDDCSAGIRCGAAYIDETAG